MEYIELKDTTWNMERCISQGNRQRNMEETDSLIWRSLEGLRSEVFQDIYDIILNN